MSTIMIVDDSNLMRMRLKEILLPLGHEIVAEAENGEEAIKKYSIHKPDIVTMDVNMPVMSGIDALTEIKQKYPDANIVIISTEGQENMIQKAIRSGARNFIIKPFKINQLVNVIRSMEDKSITEINKEIENSEIDEDISGVILTIDDSKTVLEKLRTLLKEDNHNVIQADSGEKGIEFAVSGSPDLIILDLVMPGMDGFAVMEQLKKNEITKRIPVIILSSMTKRDDILNAMKFGVADYVSKDFNDAIFKKKVKTAIYNFKVQKSQNVFNEQPVVMTRIDGQTTILFRQKLSDIKTGMELQKILSRSFISLIQKERVIFDLRMAPALEKPDLGVIVELLELLKGVDISLVAGKHYGSLVAETNLEESINLFISHGDLELFLESKGKK